MEQTNRIPVTYKNGKSEKELVDYNKLWQVAFWGFDTKIGAITNDSTTTYEIQSQFSPESEEYKECDKRLKLFRYFQGNEIDRAKNGSKVKKLPKSWTTFGKILDTDSEEDIKHKEFLNKLLIEKRPKFMKFLYSHYAKEYKAFKDDFDLYSNMVFGKDFDKLTEEDKKTEKYFELKEYYDKKNPFLETNGVMNKLCEYMQEQLKEIKPSNKKCDNEKLFDKLYNKNIELNNENLEKMQRIRQEYDDFKKTKQLKTSDYSTYEQYFKYLRNKCLQEISSDIKELANLSVYICYFLMPNKPKDFCWDVFGAGIVDNLKEKKTFVSVPCLDDCGHIEYLGDKYIFKRIDLQKEENLENASELVEIYSDEENLFDWIEDEENFNVNF